MPSIKSRILWFSETFFSKKKLIPVATNTGNTVLSTNLQVFWQKLKFFHQMHSPSSYITMGEENFFLLPLPKNFLVTLLPLFCEIFFYFSYLKIIISGEFFFTLFPLTKILILWRWGKWIDQFFWGGSEKK